MIFFAPEFLKKVEEGRARGENKHTMKYFYDMGFDTYCGVCIGWTLGNTFINIHDPKIVEAMYTTKNKYFDKFPGVRNAMHVLTGNSILFAETTEVWRQSRKAMSPAFYKGKIIQLMEIAREAMTKTHARLDGLI